MTNNRFETSKKKLGYLTFQDFVYCASLMIANLSYSSAGSPNSRDVPQRDILHVVYMKTGESNVHSLFEWDCGLLLLYKTFQLHVSDCRSQSDMEVDMDRLFLIQLRDIKLLAEKEPLEEHKALVFLVTCANLTCQLDIIVR